MVYLNDLIADKKINTGSVASINNLFISCKNFIPVGEVGGTSLGACFYLSSGAMIQISGDVNIRKSGVYQSGKNFYENIVLIDNGDKK